MQIKLFYSHIDGWMWEIREGRHLVAAGSCMTRQDCERQAKLAMEYDI